ncbi:hypothetical protein ACFL45_08765 [Candidatus Neomarinimicrobiota bacterium]
MLASITKQQPFFYLGYSILPVLFLFQGFLIAQNPNAFNSLSLGFDYMTNVNRDDFHQYWHPGTGVNGSIETPFYWGNVRVGCQITAYQARTIDVPSFPSAYVYLGWGLETFLFRRIAVVGGIQLGYDVMVFDTVNKLLVESEMQTGWYAGIIRELSEKWDVHLTFHDQVLLTNKHIYRDFFAAGIGYSIETPKWLLYFLE